MADDISPTNLSVLMQRLDTIEALLLRLCEASGDGRAPGAAKPTPVVPAPAKPTGSSKGVPALVTPATEDAVSAEPPASLLNDDQKRALSSNELDLTPWLPPLDADPRRVLEVLFRFAFEEVAVGDRLLMALIHSEILSAARSAEHLRAFNFPKLRRGLDGYLDQNDPHSFVIVRSKGEESGENLTVFVHRKSGAMPAPVRLKRDPKAENAWRVMQISL